MTTLSRQQHHFLFDRSSVPAAIVKPGAQVILETYDTWVGEVHDLEEFVVRHHSGRRSNPLTGPIFVEGAQPGDTLLVEILKIELDEGGFQAIGPTRGIVTNEIETWGGYAFKISGNELVFPNGLRVPAEPVIGAFGNAPADEPTAYANRLGGNLDVPAVRTGARLYIPVEVAGALFSLGDVHACQGDGEVVGAPEIGAKITVRLDLLEHRHSEWCMVEDATHWHSLCSAATEAEAAKLATMQNAKFIARTTNIEFGDALILLTLVGALSICRTGKWGTQGPVVSASFAKETLRHAAESYSAT